MKYLKYLLIITLCSGCFHIAEPPPSIQCAMTVLGKHIEYQKQLGYEVIGTGGAFLGGVNEISVDYSINKKVDLAEARRMFVHSMESFLEMANADINLRPYMKNYPVTPENFALLIRYMEKNERVPPPNIALALYGRNNICYFIRNIGDNDTNCIDREPYETAKAIVFEEENPVSACLNTDDSALRFSCQTTVPEDFSETIFGNFHDLFLKTYIRIDKLKNVDTLNMIKRRPLAKSIGNRIEYLTKVDPIDLAKFNSLYTPITNFGFLPGEKIAFDWKAGKYSGTFEMTPNPLHFESEDGSLAVDAELLSRKSFVFTFKGFQEGEKVKFTSISANETMSDEFTYNSSTPFGYSPAVEGLKGGYAKVIFTTESSSVTAVVPWGSEIDNILDEHERMASNGKMAKEKSSMPTKT